MNSKEYKIVKNTWKNASCVFNFDCISPYKINLGNIILDTFAFLPKYGSQSGIIICLYDFIKNGSIFPDFTSVERYAKSNGIFLSQICYKQFLKYNENVFIELLEDWGRFD